MPAQVLCPHRWWSMPAFRCVPILPRPQSSSLSGISARAHCRGRRVHRSGGISVRLCRLDCASFRSPSCAALSFVLALRKSDSTTCGPGCLNTCLQRCRQIRWHMCELSHAHVVALSRQTYSYMHECTHMHVLPHNVYMHAFVNAPLMQSLRICTTNASNALRPLRGRAD